MSRHSYRFGTLHIDALPGQSQVAHCHSLFVPPTLRGQGHGHRLKQAQMDSLREQRFDYAICTVAAANLAQKKVLAGAGWKPLDSFANTRSCGITEIWGSPVTGAAE